MADDSLLNAAGRVADGEHVDWASITSSLLSDDERSVADELAVVGQIAAGHRQLHQLLPVSSDTPPGQTPDRARWGHLDLLNIIGRGSYGTVYRAWDTRLERLVALKLFHGASDPDAVMQEGRMLARIRHENVVTVYGADVVDGVAGLWMELVHGETLDHVVRSKGPMTGVDAAVIGVDVARALGAVHAAGLLHCDVKAQNVVQESGGRVVLMDLGAGQVVPEASDSDQLSDVSGTPRYMAPELFLPGAAATKATDIYSFGVLLYYLVSGSFPTDGKSLGELKQAHLDHRVNSLERVCSWLPAAFLDLVSRATDCDPAQRPASAADLQSALATIAAPRATKPRSIGLWVAVAAGVGLLAFVIGRPLFTPAAPPAPAVRSIAVLPIRNLTGDPSKQYVADGLTEIVTANLARLSGLRVPAAASAAFFRDSKDDDKTLARKLGVQLLLAGAVVQADDRVRLSLRLIDPENDQVLWGNEIVRRPDSIMGARAEIARMVATRLALDISPQDEFALQERTIDPEAQDAYLRGIVELNARPNDRVPVAIAFLRTAVEKAPAWGEPLGELSLAELRATEAMDPALRFTRSNDIREMALRAVELDPLIASGYTALAAVQAYHDWDFPAAEATLRRGLEVSPSNGFARARLALLLAARGKLDDAVAEAELARDTDPSTAPRHTTLGIIRYYRGDFTEALADMQRALEVAPHHDGAYLGKGRIYTALGRHSDAIAQINLGLEQGRNATLLMVLAITYAAAGDRSETARVLKELEALRRQGVYVSIDGYAHIAALEGRLDEAFVLLNEAVDRRMTNVLWIAVDPISRGLRDDPRFAQLIERMRLKP